MLTLSQIRSEALRLGFMACGAAVAGPVGEWRVREWNDWLDAGRSAGMDYLLRHRELRKHPSHVLPGVRTVVSVALNYCPPVLMDSKGYRMARYAYGKDYHEVMRQKLRQLLVSIGREEGVEARVCCDTAPIDERYWAWRCGLGQWGRSAQFVLPGAGTYLFLGEILLCEDVEGALPPSASEQRPDVVTICGRCRRCLDACPACALQEDTGLDARKCLSYLTIEHRGELPSEVSSQMGNCFYGCDVCGEVCPHNRKARPTSEEAFSPSSELLAMQPEDWQALTVETYRKLFKWSAVKRAKFEGLQRNIRAISVVKDHPSDIAECSSSTQ